MNLKPYGKDFAEKLIELAGGQDSMDPRNDGVYLTEEWVEEITNTADMGWSPKRALPGSDFGSPGGRKLLPVPFACRDLGAFVLCPAAAGSLLTSLFQDNLELDRGKLKDAFSADELREYDAEEALGEASAHLTRALRIVGAKDHTLEELAQSLCEEYKTMRRAARERLGISPVSGHGLSDKEYYISINIVEDEVAAIKDKWDAARGRAEDESVRWLDAMVAAINEPGEPPSSQPSSALAQDEVATSVEKVTAASDSVQVSLLASKVGVGLEAARLVNSAKNEKSEAGWIRLAQEQARAIIKRQKERDWYPSQEHVAEEIARDFREHEIFGESGKPLSGPYIKRHALKGISSAKGKQLSTAPRQGTRSKWGNK